MGYIKIIFCAIVVIVLLAGCNRYLDKKQDQALAVPQTLADLQALLDNNNVMNVQGNGMSEVCSDNYYLTYDSWAALSKEGDRNAYIWGNEMFYNAYPNAWQSLYATVYYSNIVLENKDKIAVTPQNKATWNNVTGSAYFFRARAFHILAIGWSVAFDSATAATDLGIPLRLSSDFNLPVTRASVLQTYQQIITDLQKAIPLLPETPLHVMRPSRPAAFALLSRVYLSMRIYTKAYAYADSALQLNSSLTDYNTVNTAAANPFSRFNAEVIFHAAVTQTPLASSRAKIDTGLLASYVMNDIRKTAFFSRNSDNSYAFKGSYDGSTTLFLGLATDEVWLMKAECAAWLGNLQEALDCMNTLLVKRYKTGTFTIWNYSDKNQLLAAILSERRKELLMRELRWMDIKRLNKEGTGIMLIRILNGQTYTLLPNDPRYALPIPAYVIDLSGIPQNPR